MTTQHHEGNTITISTGEEDIIKKCQKKLSKAPVFIVYQIKNNLGVKNSGVCD